MGTAFGGVNAFYRAGIERVGSKAVNRFRRKGDESAAAKEPGSVCYHLGTWGDRINVDAQHDKHKLTCSRRLVILALVCLPKSFSVVRDALPSCRGRQTMIAFGGCRRSSSRSALRCTISLSAQSAKRVAPDAVQRYFDLVRPVFSGDRAYDQVAFMDQYFRWPGNTGFNANIRRVEDIQRRPVTSTSQPNPLGR